MVFLYILNFIIFLIFASTQCEWGKKAPGFIFATFLWISKILGESVTGKAVAEVGCGRGGCALHRPHLWFGSIGILIGGNPSPKEDPNRFQLWSRQPETFVF